MEIIILKEQERKELVDWLVLTFQEKGQAPQTIARLIHKLR